MQLYTIIYNYCTLLITYNYTLKTFPKIIINLLYTAIIYNYSLKTFPKISI